MRRTDAAATVLSSLALALVAGPAAAQAPPPLAGEQLVGGVFDAFRIDAQQCATGAQSTFSYTSRGTATGPYPGTYTETGTVVVGPQSGSPDVASGTIVSLSAQFRIDSGTTIVTGTKTLGTATSPFTQGGCRTFEPFSEGFVTLHAAEDAPFAYAARINTSTAAISEQGSGRLFGRRIVVNDPSGFPIGSSEQFEATFAATTQRGPVEPPDAQGPASLALSPPSATNPVDTDHSVTAAVKDAGGKPVLGARVRFTITGSRTFGTTCDTNAAGTCSIAFHGPRFPGTDTISAYVDSDRDGQRDTGEPAAQATKTWVLPASSTVHVNGGGPLQGDTATIAVETKGAPAPKGSCTVARALGAGKPVKCVTVDAVTRKGSQATLHGVADVGGVRQRYVIDVIAPPEGGERGFFQIVTDRGYVLSGALRGGSLKVR